MKQITKKQLVKDFENGRCCIKYDNINVKAVAVYLDGNCYLIRFDTYLSLNYPCSSSPNPKGFSWMTDYCFYNKEIADKFVAKYPNIKLINKGV